MQLSLPEVRLPVWQAFYEGVVQTYQVSIATVRSIGNMIGERSMDNIAGPVTVANALADYFETAAGIEQQDHRIPACALGSQKHAKRP